MSGLFSRAGVVAFVAVFATLFVTAAAQADEWRISQSSGPIWIGEGGVQKASLGPDTVLAGGATLTTGKGARVLLVRGTQTMIVGPDTILTVPDSDMNGITTILQQTGEVTFDIDRRNVRHFAVETPFLAAVVKGTHFTVRIFRQSAMVTVDRGLVGVTDLASGQTADVPAGQVATVAPAGMSISGTGDFAVIEQGQPRASLVSPAPSDSPAATDAATDDSVSLEASVEANAGPVSAGVGVSASGNGLALGLNATAGNSNGIGLGIGLGGGNAGGNGHGSGNH